MSIHVFFSSKMVADSQGYSPSAAIPALVVQSWLELGYPINVIEPAPVTRDQFYLAHDQQFVDGVLDGVQANGFGNRSKEVAASLPYTAGSMRGMLKEMLGRAELPLYGLNHKIEIQSPNVPALSDKVFGTIISALLHDEGIEITYATTPDSACETVQCLIKKIRILPDGWTLILQVNPKEEIEIDAAHVIEAHRLNN